MLVKPAAGSFREQWRMYSIFIITDIHDICTSSSKAVHKTITTLPFIKNANFSQQYGLGSAMRVD